MNIELTDEEFQTLKDIFDDWGSDCPYTDCSKRQILGEKLGFLEPIPEPTEEELKRREEFGKLLAPIMAASNHLLEKMAMDLVKPVEILYGSKSIVGSQLKIKLPNDYLDK